MMVLGRKAMLSVSMAIAVATLTAIAWAAQAGREQVRFPDGFEQGVRYAVVNRGSIREDLYTSREAVAAAKAGQPMPYGTVITLVDYRDGQLFRYVVMEKRQGWGAQYPDDIRNGEWEFQWFNADRSVNEAEDMSRCFSCHKPHARQDYVQSYNLMKTAN